MPWDNNSNDGGGRNGGPWGQIPGGGGGPRRPGGNSTNIEDLFKRGRDHLPAGLPGGRWLILIGVVALGGFWLSQSVYTVAPQEVGVEMLFGVPKDQLAEPGLHFLMWPVERVERVSLTQNQTIIGSTGASRAGTTEGLMLTGDQNIVDVGFSVFWQIGRPADYLFNVRGPDELVRRAAESAMREVVGRRPAQDVFRDDRAGVELDVLEITQSILESYGTGINVSKILLENVAPPTEVADAFDEVQRAEQDEDRFQEEARQYSNTLLGDARGQAARAREEAAAYKDRVVKEAEGEAQRFVSVYEEYAKAPDVTRRRLYLETIESVLNGSQKVVVESGASGSGIVPYLPLPELRAQQQSNSSTNAGGQ
ncbi:MAG: FtsH protease activity modulator HflK [Alphaproteobacteria bacterium]|nr:FtsH protease activity modulator HflK [Alphaproteobacteria bacterium]